MSYLIQPIHLLILSIFLLLAIIPYWQIFKKAGFAPALSLLMIVPLANLLILYYIAFAKWTTQSRIEA